MACLWLPTLVRGDEYGRAAPGMQGEEHFSDGPVDQPGTVESSRLVQRALIRGRLKAFMVGLSGCSNYSCLRHAVWSGGAASKKEPHGLPRRHERAMVGAVGIRPDQESRGRRDSQTSPWTGEVSSRLRHPRHCRHYLEWPSLVDRVRPVESGPIRGFATPLG